MAYSTTAEYNIIIIVLQYPSSDEFQSVAATYSVREELASLL